MEEERAREILEGFSQKKVLVVGDFCLDEYVFGETDELSPEFPVLRLFIKEKKHVPGAAGNVASGVKALEAQTFAVGVIGNDANGSILLDELSKRGINTEGLIKADNRHTPTYSRIIYSGMRRPKQHLARLDVENEEELSESARETITDFLCQKIPEIDAVIVADYEEVAGRGLITAELIGIISFLAKKYEKKTFAVSRKRIHLFENFTAIIPNDLEAMKAADQEAKTEADFQEIAKKLKEQLNLEAAFITRGAEGISVLEKERWSTYPSVVDKVIDVCGAGDTVTCTAALSVLSGANFSEAAILGNHAASITVSKEGTVSVTRKELQELISQNQKSEKLKTLEEIETIVQESKTAKKKITFLNGYFDPIHIGHIELINKAKKLGGILVVGLNSDKSVRENKGPERPFLHQEKRAEILCGLEAVDYVVLFDELTPIQLIKEIVPDILVKGNNYRKEEVVGKEIVEAAGGQVALIDIIQGITSDGVLESIHGRKENLRNKIAKTLDRQQGILFAEPAMVHRSKYSGRDIIAKNSRFAAGYVDDRGYVPVEWWIMSKTPAENEIAKEGEGLSSLVLETELGKEKVLFKEAAEINGEKLLGEFAPLWPLTKILDIGGELVKTSFSSVDEVPPIPCHVHSGNIINGKCKGKGKLEAYFFPPVNVPPYSQNFGRTITRLGIKSNISKVEVAEKLKQFGKDDSMYELCNTYEINAYDGWTILPGVVHAPGPWPTFEIQLPQDDFNLCSWQLSKRFSSEELSEKKQELQLRGLKDESAFVEEAINWEVSTDAQFKEKYYQPAKVLQQGPWGRQMQIFFDQFYGEAFEILPGQSWVRNADLRPFAGIVWSGRGLLNGNSIDVDNKERKEFLVVPDITITIKNTGETPLLIYTVFPMQNQMQHFGAKFE